MTFQAVEIEGFSKQLEVVNALVYGAAQLMRVDHARKARPPSAAGELGEEVIILGVERRTATEQLV